MPNRRRSYATVRTVLPGHSLRLSNHDVHRRALGEWRGASLPSRQGAAFVRVKILGSSAGGGFPQWNCNCRNCAGLRAGTLHARPRSQSSIAVSSDGKRWIVCNASPDILAQIRCTPELQPTQLRGSGIAAVVLTDGQIDHAAGLLLLREGERLPLYTTELVRSDLTEGFPILGLL